tara:strand:- start:73 stop:459 length:387 start_codon:yes stop_codon:yes gene_type:complete
MSSQILLSGGDKWYSYSGEIFGDVSVPATIPMITIDNTGLRDSMVQIQFYTGQDITTAGPDGIGVLVKLDDISIYNSQSGVIGRRDSLRVENMINIFAPRNSKLEVISLNTAGNNTQIRGANLLGYYL